MEDKNHREQQDTIDQAVAKRNLGSVGGGNVPAGIHTDMNNLHDPEAAQSLGKEGEHKKQTLTSPSGMSQGADRLGQGSIGGRTPGQPQTPLGDQDSTRNRGEDDPYGQLSDPMTSRAPNKINQQKNSTDPENV